ncbi:hypothetical protein Trydic_g9964 [Trypoxylus dichotomus]
MSRGTLIVFVFGLCFGAVLSSETVKRNCKCVLYYACDGKINPYVQCHPSYGFVCCVLPERISENNQYTEQDRILMELLKLLRT